MKKMKSKKEEDTDDAFNDEYKIYREKPYENSSGNPFGVSINGRVKDYIQAHNNIREMMVKGRIYNVEYKLSKKDKPLLGKIKFLNIIVTNGLMDATVQVTPQRGPTGHVQMKCYAKSNSKKKGATTELRKLSDYDFSYVMVLKGILTNLLDRFIQGTSVGGILEESKTSRGCLDTSNILEMVQEAVSCDLCNFKTKSKSGLKTHKTRIHGTINNNCASCDYVANDKTDLNNHFDSKHKVDQHVRKRTFEHFTCKKCNSTFDSKTQLSKHEQIQHDISESVQENSSPSSSPLRKKTYVQDINDVEMKDTEDIEADAMDSFEDSTENMKNSTDKVELDNALKRETKETNEKFNENIKCILEERIKELELIIENDKAEKIRLNDEIAKLVNKKKEEHEVGAFKSTINKKPFEIPNHLKSVHEEHIKNLRGFKMRYCSIPDGACLINCLTAHISCTENETERKINNRRVNNHIADNFDKFYHNKISLPYIETVGVGFKAKTVRKNTREEFLEFLRSEDSLCAFANSQEIFAIANMLNITIWIFSYGVGGDNSRTQWTEFGPDPTMSDSAHFPKGWVPDMYLYNSDQTHYDLLVAEDHRLALLGLVGGENNDKCASQSSADDWKVVGLNKKNKHAAEKLLLDNKDVDYDDKDLEELDDEIVLTNSKKNGARRTDPTSEPQFLSPEISMLSCTWKNCKMQLESEGLLISHMKEHRPSFACNICENEFMTETQLNEHVSSFHRMFRCEICGKEHTSKEELKLHEKEKHVDGEWNCNDCSFQAHTSGELMKHLHVCGHQPSPNIRDMNTEIKRCFTCNEEFFSKWHLMNHRKEKHPSNKICRYYLKNQCIHGSVKCWYRHEEAMDIEAPVNEPSSPSLFKCNFCANSFNEKNDLINHKRKNHPSIGPCRKYIQGQCDRSETECLFNHEIEKAQEKEAYSQDVPVFQLASPNPAPPDKDVKLLEFMNSVLQKLTSMEDMFQRLKQ